MLSWEERHPEAALSKRMAHVLWRGLKIMRILKDSELSGSRRLRDAMLKQSRRLVNLKKENRRMAQEIRSAALTLFKGDESVVPQVIDRLMRSA